MNKTHVTNVYTCMNHHQTVTKDVDDGTTPFMIDCPDCGAWAQSASYQVRQARDHTHEFYRPAYPERLTNSGTRQHVEAGGLLLRRVGEPDETLALRVRVTHEVKCLPEYYDDLALGIKSFEVRKNDRNYQQWDTLLLRRWDGTDYTGESVKLDITYILPGGQFGIEPGYCVMAVAPGYDSYDSIFTDYNGRE